MLTIDEGYFYGIGAFETIAVEDGNPILLEEHYARLLKAMDFLKLSHSLKEIQEKTEEILAKPELKTGRHVLKITVSPQNLLVTDRKNTYTPEDYERGFITAYSTVKRNETSPFTYHKTLNYGDCLLEKRLAKANGIDEPIFLNTRGELSEGATTNLFFVKNGELFTPPAASGLLPGIMRDYICSRYPVTQRVIYPQEIAEFDEMFLTNSLLGIMPVTCLEDFQFSSRERGDQLLEDYRLYLESR